MKTFQYSSDEIILEVEDICNECDKKLGQETQIFNLREWTKMLTETNLKRLHKDICLSIKTYEFESDHLTYETFKTIIKNYVEVEKCWLIKRNKN